MNRSKELCLKWLNSAKNDLKYAKGNFELGYYPTTCFLCQQAGEKALKAFLFFNNQKLIKTHDLERLLEKAISFEKDFFKIQKHCQVLDNYYTDTRYPDIWDYDRFNDKKLASEAIELAEEVLKFVEGKIKT